MKNKNLKIVFLGREFGQILKEKLKKAGFNIVDPATPKVDLIVVGFYGKILSKETIESPAYGSLNVHPSLLPKYRGATPVQRTILNGDTETGVTIILMDEQIDHGQIVASEKFEIGNKQFTTPELTKELWELGGELLVKTIPKWVAGEITPQEQNHSQATYTKLLTKKDGRLDWSKTALELERQVRAFIPWPGSFFIWRGKKIEVIRAEVLKYSKSQPGKAVKTESGDIAIQTSKDALSLKIIKPEGKNEMTSKQFLNGHPDILHAVLE